MSSQWPAPINTYEKRPEHGQLILAWTVRGWEVVGWEEVGSGQIVHSNGIHTLIQLPLTWIPLPPAPGEGEGNG